MDRILPGITRKVVLKLAKEEFNVCERKIHIEEIPLMEEAFITSSIREVVPVVKIDSRRLGEKPGLRTLRVMELFRQYASQ